MQEFRVNMELNRVFAGNSLYDRELTSAFCEPN